MLTHFNNPFTTAITENCRWQIPGSFCSSSKNAIVKELLKLVNVWLSYCQHKSCAFLWLTVYNEDSRSRSALITSHHICAHAIEGHQKSKLYTHSRRQRRRKCTTGISPSQNLPPGHVPPTFCKTWHIFARLWMSRWTIYRQMSHCTDTKYN